MARNVRERLQQLVHELVPVCDEGFQQASVCSAVTAEVRCCVLERPSYDHGRPIVERMRDCSKRLDQVELELERAEEWGRGDQWMDRGADVMSESGKRQLRSARPAADRLLRLDDADGAPGLCERDRGGKAVRPGADDDGA